MERYWRQHRGHYRATLRLGVPVVISQLGQITVGLADSIMIGRLGATELATAAFANTLFSLPLIFGMGFAMSLTPFTGRAWARKDYASRSEERRVGKECRSRWSRDHYKKKKYIKTLYE